MSYSRKPLETDTIQELAENKNIRITRLPTAITSLVKRLGNTFALRIYKKYCILFDGALLSMCRRIDVVILVKLLRDNALCEGKSKL